MAIKIIKDKCKGCTLCVKACPFRRIDQWQTEKLSLTKASAQTVTLAYRKM